MTKVTTVLASGRSNIAPVELTCPGSASRVAAKNASSTLAGGAPRTMTPFDTPAPTAYSAMLTVK